MTQEETSKALQEIEDLRKKLRAQLSSEGLTKKAIKNTASEISQVNKKIVGSQEGNSKLCLKYLLKLADLFASYICSGTN